MAHQSGFTYTLPGNHYHNVFTPIEEPMEVDEEETINNLPSKTQGSTNYQGKEECPICLDAISNVKILDKCSHRFCTECIESQFKYKPQCPICFTVYGIIHGNQPPGHMDIKYIHSMNLPGYEQYGTIMLSYYFNDSTQTSEHPNPGQPYYGTSREAFLPNCCKGQTVARLLRVAFDRRLLFTVGRSRTTGMDNCVTWNDVHHKTCPSGGPENFGYPDHTYLDRVLEELAAKGVSEQDLNSSNLMELICRDFK